MVFVATLTLLSAIQFLTGILPEDLAEDYLDKSGELQENKLTAHMTPYIRGV